jgi:hypothetical protein
MMIGIAHIMGSRKIIAVTHADGRTVFDGPAGADGYPGPVFLSLDGSGNMWHRVDSPERFGDTFGHAWIAAFYGQEV